MKKQNRVILRWFYYFIMCIASFITVMFGLFIIVQPECVSEDVRRVPVGIALMLVGFVCAMKYMMLGFDNAAYHDSNMKF